MRQTVSVPRLPGRSRGRKRSGRIPLKWPEGTLPYVSDQKKGKRGVGWLCGSSYLKLSSRGTTQKKVEVEMFAEDATRSTPQNVAGHGRLGSQGQVKQRGSPSGAKRSHKTKREVNKPLRNFRGERPYTTQESLFLSEATWLKTLKHQKNEEETGGASPGKKGREF